MWNMRWELREIEVDKNEIDSASSNEDVVVVFSDVCQCSWSCLGY
jgi:hypothetical protein